MVAIECPEFEGGEHFAVQQGAGMVVTKTEDEPEEQIEASVEFLKWFTQDERNIQFSLDSGYMPVTKEANNLETIEKSTSLKENDRTFSVVKAAIDTVNDNTLYTTKAFENGKNARSILEYSMSDKASGSYLLGIENNSDTEITNVLISGTDYGQVNGKKKTTEIYTENDRTLIRNDLDEDIYCDVEYLTLYNTNTPFEQQRWVLTGIIRGKNLFRFSSTVEKTLRRGTLYTLIAGIVGGIIISLFISRPVTALTKSVRKLKPFSQIQFSRTGIREIDLMASELEHLNRETLYAAERFRYIINTANLPLAVFEVNSEDDSVFITGRFFEMLGLEYQDFTDMTEKQFWNMFASLDPYKQASSAHKENESLYKIPLRDCEELKYIRVTLHNNGERCIGLVEDITDTAIEKETIEYERDHDLLTGLLNRRAFNRVMTELFEQGKIVLRTAALVMVDLDELKRVNDTYGHEYGDKYIRTAAECFEKYTPQSTIICRRFGDEFNQIK